MAIILFNDKLQLSFDAPFQRVENSVLVDQDMELSCEQPQGSVFLPPRDQSPSTYTINFKNSAPFGSLNCYNLYEYKSDTPFNVIQPGGILIYNKY